MKMKKLMIILVYCGVLSSAFAQQYATIATSPAPLTLKAQGSFYLGGELESQTTDELGGICPPGHITVNQMYVRYMIPQEQTDGTSFVLIHGMHLSGKCWETTPDGRMGWDEYLVRKGYAVYVVDQVGIGRSGFDQKTYNDVRKGKTQPMAQTPFSRKTDENSWTNFRFGTKDGNPVDGAQFPIGSLDEFSKQNLPHIMRLPSPDANYRCLSKLSAEVKNVVLVSHSQSGAFPVETALRSTEGIRGMVLLEPGGTGSGYGDEQIRQLSKIPLLIIFGDNLTNETGMPGHVWQNSMDGWSRLAESINKAGGNATVIHLPEMGIYGNSHMLMMDKNSHQIAAIVLEWCKNNITKKSSDEKSFQHFR